MRLRTEPYEDVGRSIRVEAYPERVEVTSPGGMPEPVTEQNIRDTQSARNATVLGVLRRLRLAEDIGRGVDVIQDEMAEALLDPPRFEELGHSVRVILPIRGDKPARAGMDPGGGTSGAHPCIRSGAACPRSSR